MNKTEAEKPRFALHQELVRIAQVIEGAATTAVERRFTTIEERLATIEHRLEALATLGLSASPDKGGKVTGGGIFPKRSWQTVMATANPGYRFANWTEHGKVVSPAESYTFPVDADRILVANFTRKKSKT